MSEIDITTMEDAARGLRRLLDQYTGTTRTEIIALAGHRLPDNQEWFPGVAKQAKPKTKKNVLPVHLL